MRKEYLRRPHTRAALIKTAAVLLAFAVIALGHGGTMTRLRELPEAVYAESEEELYQKLGPLLGNGLTVAASSTSDETLGARNVSVGVLPGLRLGSIPAYVVTRPSLVPGGEAVGISIRMSGVLVVGFAGYISEDGSCVSPAAKAGLKAGDLIISVNGTPVDTSDELLEELELAGNEAILVIERGGKRMEISVAPGRGEDGVPRIGAWVRDSTVGVGTLSFFETGSGIFAALGHPVLDADTGSLLPVREGQLRLASILGVVKGRQGVPGELQGSFGRESEQLGEILSNTELGIFGRLGNTAQELLSGSAVPIAFPDEVHTGDASIICSASGVPEEYACRIVRTGRQSAPAPKGLVVEITDERLIELTGGIVQGMSGSPILQDGRLAGAVTHVFVNDPLRGYGAYAYWMYKEAKDPQ